MNLMERLYDAAGRVGFLKQAVWIPNNGQPSATVSVAFQAPDDAVLDGYQLSADYRIRFPASRLIGLVAPDIIRIDGIHYRVRDVRAIGDGSEHEARLCLP